MFWPVISPCFFSFSIRNQITCFIVKSGWKCAFFVINLMILNLSIVLKFLVESCNLVLHILWLFLSLAYSFFIMEMVLLLHSFVFSVCSLDRVSGDKLICEDLVNWFPLSLSLQYVFQKLLRYFGFLKVFFLTMVESEDSSELQRLIWVEDCWSLMEIERNLSFHSFLRIESSCIYRFVQ